MFWRDLEIEVSIVLVRFEKGFGILSEYKYASNQFMFCLFGRYVYLSIGTILIKGSFYWNPKGVVYGPIWVEEMFVLFEVYDGLYYLECLDFYDNDEDAR